MTPDPTRDDPPLLHIHAQPSQNVVLYTAEYAREKHEDAIWPWNRYSEAENAPR